MICIALVDAKSFNVNHLSSLSRSAAYHVFKTSSLDNYKNHLCPDRHPLPAG